MLNNLAPTIRSGPLQLVVVLACLAGLLGGFSVLMDTFRRKKYVARLLTQPTLPLPPVRLVACYKS